MLVRICTGTFAHELYILVHICSRTLFVLLISSDSVAEHLLTWWLTLAIYEQIKVLTMTNVLVFSFAFGLVWITLKQIAQNSNILLT